MTETHDSGHGSGGHDSGGHGHGAGHAAPGHGNPGHGNPGHGHGAAGHGNPGHGNPGHGNPGRVALGHGAVGHVALGHGPRHGGHERGGGIAPAALLRGTGAVVLLAVVLLPFFFVIARLAITGAVPGEDYARFLLSLLGLPGGAVPGSPFGYRGLAVLAAVPFYVGLPAVALPDAPAGMPAELVRATAALALLSQLSLAGMLYATYRLARDRAGQDPITALLAAGLLFVLSWYTQVTALDPLAMLLIVLGLYLLQNRAGFTLLLLATPVINEQIAIVFAVWLSLRCATSHTDRDALGLQWATAIAALLIYAALIIVVHLPGAGGPFDPLGYVQSLRETLASQATTHALTLNLLPVVLLFGLGLAGHVGRRPRPAARPRGEGVFRPVDLLVIPAMLGVALVQTELFEIGRVVMQAAPIFVVPAAAAMAHRLGGTTASGEHPAGDHPA
jgi:hypothetical protein